MNFCVWVVPERRRRRPLADFGIAGDGDGEQRSHLYCGGWRRRGPTSTRSWWATSPIIWSVAFSPFFFFSPPTPRIYQPIGLVPDSALFVFFFCFLYDCIVVIVCSNAQLEESCLWEKKICSFPVSLGIIMSRRRKEWIEIFFWWCVLVKKLAFVTLAASLWSRVVCSLIVCFRSHWLLSTSKVIKK